MYKYAFYRGIMKNKQYTKTVDFYALGCLTYYLLSGKLFSDPKRKDKLSHDEIYANVQNNDDAADFIVHLTHRHDKIPDCSGKFSLFALLNEHVNCSDHTFAVSSPIHDRACCKKST